NDAPYHLGREAAVGDRDGPLARGLEMRDVSAGEAAASVAMPVTWTGAVAAAAGVGEHVDAVEADRLGGPAAALIRSHESEAAHAATVVDGAAEQGADLAHVVRAVGHAPPRHDGRVRIVREGRQEADRRHGLRVVELALARECHVFGPRGSLGGP